MSSGDSLGRRTFLPIDRRSELISLASSKIQVWIPFTRRESWGRVSARSASTLLALVAGRTTAAKWTGASAKEHSHAPLQGTTPRCRRPAS